MADGIGSLSELLDFSGWSVWINIAIFSASAIVVWITGTRMVRLVDELASRTGMGHGFAGMLLLGGIVSLTEISTVSTAAFTASPLLALNNLLGSESINLVLLAAVDPLVGREALTSFITTPAILLQGVLVVIVLAVISIAMATGDYPVFGVGIWSAAVFLLCLGALWMSARYEKRRVWVALGRDGKEEDDSANVPVHKPRGGSLRMLIVGLIGVAAVIFGAGFLLSVSGDALAEQTGLGTSFVGFLLVGMSTSLPELSTITAAVRLKRYHLAVGDILGSNVFNLLLIFLADVVYIGDPVLNHTGRFEFVACMLAIVMTGILLLGLLERRNWTVLKMGYDSTALIVVFMAGVVLLYALSGPSA
ncbi:sodium:calcium antiporter [Bradyrhizobium sp. sGM-13]|uniref:sodium:calcium antiporter n=1 Tax=Bradyrhizobium sp. sGM-13 TaxID=2831781 RepID=UPI001BD06914|nr:sodium:calcium antiporter [Bradyrhizobium sp. sGM-13]